MLISATKRWIFWSRSKHVLELASSCTPGRYETNQPISNATLNRVIDATLSAIRARRNEFESFTVHDLRRTASTHLHEAGFNGDWIEKCLAHEQRGVRAVYSKAEYAAQRITMLQAWADMVDAWVMEGPNPAKQGDITGVAGMVHTPKEAALSG